LELYIGKEKNLNDVSTQSHKPAIEKALKDIEASISTIEERMNENLTFSDEKINGSRDFQCSDSINQLTELKKDIIDRWNRYCLNLCHARRQQDCFMKIKNVTEKMSWCYFLAEEIYQDLRNTRITEDKRSVHKDLLNQHVLAFSKLHKLVLNTTEQNRKEQPPINIFSCVSYPILQNQVKFIHSVSELLNEKIECGSLPLEGEIKLCLANMNTNYLKIPTIANEIDLITIQDYETYLNKFKDQKELFDNKLKDYEQKIKDAYEKILPEICKLAADSINYEGDVLETVTDSYYDHCFTKAYDFETIKIAKEKLKYAKELIATLPGAETIGSLVKSGINAFYSSEKQEDQDLEFIPVRSPFEEEENVESNENENI
jgi:hypothetical protein